MPEFKHKMSVFCSDWGMKSVSEKIDYVREMVNFSTTTLNHLITEERYLKLKEIENLKKQIIMAKKTTSKKTAVKKKVSKTCSVAGSQLSSAKGKTQKKGASTLSKYC